MVIHGGCQSAIYQILQSMQRWSESQQTNQMKIKYSKSKKEVQIVLTMKDVDEIKFRKTNPQKVSLKMKSRTAWQLSAKLAEILP